MINDKNFFTKFGQPSGGNKPDACMYAYTYNLVAHGYTIYLLIDSFEKVTNIINSVLL